MRLKLAFAALSLLAGTLLSLGAAQAATGDWHDYEVSKQDKKLTCELWVDPPRRVHSGESFTLKWKTKNAVSVTIDHGVGTVAKSGSVQLSGLGTSMPYVLTATEADPSVIVKCKVYVRAAVVLKDSSGNGGGAAPPQAPTPPVEQPCDKPPHTHKPPCEKPTPPPCDHPAPPPREPCNPPPPPPCDHPSPPPCNDGGHSSGDGGEHSHGTSSGESYGSHHNHGG